MRIVFVNIHCNDFILKTVAKRLTKRSFSPKHKYLLDYLLDNGYEVACYVNKRGNFLMSNFGGKGSGLLSLNRFNEFNYVLRKSGFGKNSIKLIRTPEQIREDDIVIYYSLWESQFDGCEQTKAFKAVSMIHFYGDKKQSSYVEKCNPDILFAEADLSKNSEIFKRNFKWFNKNFLLLPFVYQDRFKSITSFSKRKNKAVAMGTLTHYNGQDFLDVYGSDVYQPLRKQILDNAGSLSDIIDSYISEYAENDKQKKIADNEYKIIKLYKLLYNMFHVGKQTNYFSFNMVAKYNEYKICIVPEDIQGMPGIGFVEGMACGCAYIGLDYRGYTDYGMIPRKHFIPYDGTLEDLRAKVEYYVSPEHERELSEIAQAGYMFVRDHFSKEKAAGAFMNALLEAYNRKNGVKENY